MGGLPDRFSRDPKEPGRSLTWDRFPNLSPPGPPAAGRGPDSHGRSGNLPHGGPRPRLSSAVRTQAAL